MKEMKNNKSRILVKAVITTGCMIAVNDFLCAFAPIRSAQTLHRIASNIGGLSIGYLVGSLSADCVLNALDRVEERVNNG